MRIAYFVCPQTATCATPSIVEIVGPTSVSAYSFTVVIGKLTEFIDSCRMGWSVGFTFGMEGGGGMWGGSLRETAEIEFWTSCAAASILRSRLNCSVTFELPRELDEVILVKPAIVENCRSSGAATEDAMVSA